MYSFHKQEFNAFNNNDQQTHKRITTTFKNRRLTDGGDKELRSGGACLE